MKRLFPSVVLISLIVGSLFFSSCSTTGGQTPRQFSLSRDTDKKNEIGLLVGSVSYGAGFFFPSSSDILDISLLKTDSTTGLVSEISHQRIRNLLNFPVQFTVGYDKADLQDTDTCTLIVTLLVNDNVKAQGISLIQRSGTGLAETSLAVMPV